MTSLITFFALTGIWMVAIVIDLVLRKRREKRARAADALWRLTGEGEAPLSVVIEAFNNRERDTR